MKKASLIITVSILSCLFYLWVYSATGRVKVKHIQKNAKSAECEEVALNLLIESIENSRWLQRRFYEVHIVSDHCHMVFNYYPAKSILSTANQPCSGFGSRFLLSIPELTALKNRKLVLDDLIKSLRRAPENTDFDVPNSLCDLFFTF